MQDGTPGRRAKIELSDAERLEMNRTDVLLHSSVNILLDTLSIEDMAALGLNGVLCDLIAQSADRCVALMFHKLVSVRLAAYHEIRMTRHLPHSRQPSGYDKANLVHSERKTYRLKMLE